MDLLAIYRDYGHEIIDYQSLMTYLKGYHAPRDKITRWLNRGDLIRVKKGLYVFATELTQQMHCSELLANLIYGPSAISLHSALAFYGLIPEKVVGMFSITCKRDKKYHTPLGDFFYRYMPLKKYAVGLQLVEIKPKLTVLMASPEKAICDLLYFASRPPIFKCPADVSNFLQSDLRITMTENIFLHKQRLVTIECAYRRKAVSQFVKNFGDRNA